MKRLYTRKNSKKVHEDALEQFRSLRKRMESQHPDLLGDLRENLFQQEKSDVEAAAEGMVRVDKKKNIATVLKLLELKDGADDFKRELSKML